MSPSKIDGSEKNRKAAFGVIPAKAGIQYFKNESRISRHAGSGHDPGGWLDELNFFRVHSHPIIMYFFAT